MFRDGDVTLMGCRRGRVCDGGLGGARKSEGAKRKCTGGEGRMERDFVEIRNSGQSAIEEDGREKGEEVHRGKCGGQRRPK